MLDAKLRNLSVIEATGAILIARVDDAEEAYQICRAAVDGGVRAVEVPLTVPPRCASSSGSRTTARDRVS